MLFLVLSVFLSLCLLSDAEEADSRAANQVSKPLLKEG